MEHILKVGTGNPTFPTTKFFFFGNTGQEQAGHKNFVRKKKQGNSAPIFYFSNELKMLKKVAVPGWGRKQSGLGKKGSTNGWGGGGEPRGVPRERGES